MAAKLLDIYLNDHLAAARIEVELARRVRGSNAGDAVFGAPLAELCAEIEADQETLQEVMRSDGIRPGVVKPAAAWAAEKFGRLKLNGQLRGYSPLSRVVELEGLRLAIAGKARMWAALGDAEASGDGTVDFALLARRAGKQAKAVDRLHDKAAASAFGE